MLSTIISQPIGQEGGNVSINLFIHMDIFSYLQVLYTNNNIMILVLKVKSVFCENIIRDMSKSSDITGK